MVYGATHVSYNDNMTLQFLSTTKHSRTNCWDMELLSPSPFVSVKETHISKDYLPRDKVTKEHILCIMGSRLKNNHDLIESEMAKCQLMKSKFLRFARSEIVKGFVKCACTIGWKLDGQPITAMSHLYEYIHTSEWDKDLKQQLHFLQHRRFKMNALFIRWDKTIMDTFCKNHNIKFYPDAATEQSVTDKKRRGITRECFLTLSSMIKNDYNTKLRKACEKAHNACIKERADTTQIIEGNVNRGGKRHYGYTDEFVRNVKIIDDAITGRSEVEKLRADNRRLNAEVASLRQDNSESLSDFRFEAIDDFDVSVFMMFLLQMIFLSNICFKSIYNIYISFIGYDGNFRRRWCSVS